MPLADKLKELRIKRRLSLQDVADSVGVSKAHLWDLESGRSKNPSIQLLKGLGNCFGVGVSDLIEENPDSDQAGSRALGLYRELKDLSETDLDIIQQIIARLKNKHVV